MRACSAAGASERLQNRGAINPENPSEGLACLLPSPPPFLSLPRVYLQLYSLSTDGTKRDAPLGGSWSAHGGPRRCGAQMMITALRTSLPLLERQRHTLPSKSPRSPLSPPLSGTRVPSLLLSRSVLLLEQLPLRRSVTFSLLSSSFPPSLHPPLCFRLGSVRCNSYHLRTGTVSLINYASLGIIPTLIHLRAAIVKTFPH